MQLPAWALGLWTRAEPYAARLAVWRGYEKDLQSLLIYAVGIAIYTALVFAFYQNLSKREAFTFRHRSGFWGSALHVVETSLLFPLMSFLYFAVLGLSLFVLAKSQGTTQLVTLSMAVVLGVRVCAFVSENASVDLAKMLPLSLLGVLLVDPTYATLGATWGRILEVPSLVPLLSRYFLLFIVVEGALRLGNLAVRRVRARLVQRRAKRVPVADAEAEPRAATLSPVAVRDLKTDAVHAPATPLPFDH